MAQRTGWSVQSGVPARGFALQLRALLLLLVLLLAPSLGAPSSAFAEEEPSPGRIGMDNPDPLPEPELTGLDSEGNELTPESPYAESRAHGGIEEMLVTASKRAETLQSVPISMTALGGETLRDAGVTTFNEIQNFVPNLEIIPVTDTRSTSIRIRGIGSVGSNAGIDPSVGVFIDGVYQGRAGMSVGDLLDIERVEVLRGPQGTLYGKNTAAGAINIITRRPDSEQTLFVETVLGNYSDFQVRGSANYPLLEDQLALRVAGFSSQRDGWDINRFDGQDVNNVDKWGMRAKLLWDVTDDFSLLLSGDYSEEDSRSFVAEIIDYKANGPSLMDVPFGFVAGSQGSILPVADPFDFQVGANVQPINKVQVGGISLDAIYDWGDHEIRWLNAWRTYSTDSQFDGDFSEFDGVLAFQNVDLNQFSSELTLASPGGDFFEYQGGLYFFYMNMKTVDRNGWEDGLVAAGRYACNLPNVPAVPVNPNPAASCNLPPAPPGGPWPTLTFFAPNFNINKNTHKTKTAAAYGQGRLRLLDSLGFVAGFRVSWEEKSRNGLSECTGAMCALLEAPPILGPTFARDDELSKTDFQYRFALEYEPREGDMIYASVANGFKSGGFNQLRTVQGESSEFGDETSLTYELGLRSMWFEPQVIFNMTGYFTDYDDFQAQVFTGSSINVRNAGRLFCYGFESDFVYMPDAVKNLQLGAAVGLNIARYDEFDTAAGTVPEQASLAANTPPADWPLPYTGQVIPAALACGLTPQVINCSQNLKGKTLDNAPEWNISAFGAYEYPVPSADIDLFARADYSYSDSFFLDQDLDPNLYQPSYHLLNLRAGFKASDDSWSLTAWATNVTNSEYLVIGFDVPILSGYAGVRGPPRQVGATLRMNF